MFNNIDEIKAAYPDEIRSQRYLDLVVEFINSNPTKEQTSLFGELMALCTLETHLGTQALNKNHERLSEISARLEDIEIHKAQAELKFLQPTKH